jgi:flagellar protein FliT
MMLRLATDGLWDELIASEMDYVNAVQNIAQLTQDSQPSDPLQEQLRPLLRTVLDNESQVKRLLQARMDELAKLVGQSSIQKTVMTTYGNQGGYVLVPQDNVDSNH